MIVGADLGRMSLGVTMPEGSPVYLEPRLGPLLLFGHSKAGKSFAMKKLSTRPADAGQRVLVLSSAEYTWHRVARARGGTAVVLGPGAPFPTLDPDATFLVVSTLASFPGPRTEKVPPYALTPQTLDEALGANEDRRWLFVEKLDHFLRDEALAEYLALFWARARRPGAYAVGSVQDYPSFAYYPRALPLLTDSRARLVMRQENLRSARMVARALREDHLRLATTSKGPIPPPEAFLRLGVGEGFLVDSGAGAAEASPLYVDYTEDEMRAFDTRPRRHRDRRSRRGT